MGAVEEGGKVASGIVEGLKSSPVILAIIVLNVILVSAALYFLNTLAENARHHREDLMKQNAAQFEQLVRLCQQSRDYRLQSDDPPTDK